MRALVAVGAPDLVALHDVEPPAPEPGHALIDVHAVSVNREELHQLDAPANLGWRPGWDLAGTVVRSCEAAPPVGTPVLGILAGGSWAERVSVPASQLTAIPAGLETTTAASLPMAGLTAMRVLRAAGPVAGRKVLVLGASGSVGRLLVQLAHRAGAHVTAVAGRPQRVAELERLGAHVAVLEVNRAQRHFDVVFDSVGGDLLCTSVDLVAPRGTIVSYGNSSRGDTTLSIGDFYEKQAVLRGFHLLRDLALAPPAADLAELARMVVQGELELSLVEVVDWTEAPICLEYLRGRLVRGKIVLEVQQAGR